jgi:hypothetical protein
MTTAVEKLRGRLDPLFASVDPDVARFVLDDLRNPYGRVVVDSMEQAEFARHTDQMGRQVGAILRGVPRDVVTETLRQIGAELTEEVNQ